MGPLGNFDTHLRIARIQEEHLQCFLLLFSSADAIPASVSLTLAPTLQQSSALVLLRVRHSLHWTDRFSLPSPKNRRSFSQFNNLCHACVPHPAAQQRCLNALTKNHLSLFWMFISFSHQLSWLHSHFFHPSNLFFCTWACKFAAARNPSLDTKTVDTDTRIRIDAWTYFLYSYFWLTQFYTRISFEYFLLGF